MWPVSVESTWLFIVFGVLYLLCFSLLSILLQNLGLEECIVCPIWYCFWGGRTTRCCWRWSELGEILLFAGGLKSARETDWSSSVELSSRFVCRSWGVAWLLELFVCPGMRSWEAFIFGEVAVWSPASKVVEGSSLFWEKERGGRAINLPFPLGLRLCVEPELWEDLLELECYSLLQPLLSSLSELGIGNPNFDKEIQWWKTEKKRARQSP